MSASTSVAAHTAATASGGATKASATGWLALRAKPGLFHPATAAGKTTVAGAGASGHASGSAAGAAGAHGAGSATAHVGITTLIGAHLGAKTHAGAVALKTSMVAKCLAVASVGLVGIVVAAHTGMVPAAQAGVSGVPSWSTGPSIVAHVQAGLGLHSSGSGGLHIRLRL
jgi:trimeric autotransporter adhesin